MTERSEESTEKRRPSIFWLLAAVVVPAVGLMARIRIRGEEKLPAQGAYVLAPNHCSEIDPLIVAVAVWRMGRAPRFMAKESLFRVPVLGAALRATGMVPVERRASASSARHTLGQARELVEHGRGVIVYPEGTLTRDPDMWPMRGKTGAVRLALQGDLPVIPLAHWGAQEILPRYGKRLRLWPLRKPIEIVLGDPVPLDDLRGRAHEQGVLAEGTTRVMNEITRLLEDLRGEKAPEERWNPSAHDQSETGRYES